MMFRDVLGPCHAAEIRGIPVLKTCSPTWLCAQLAAGSAGFLLHFET